MSTNYSEGTVTVGAPTDPNGSRGPGGMRFLAPGRVVALLEKLRAALDSLLEGKIAHPTLDLATSEELAIAVKLIACDGMS